MPNRPPLLPGSISAAALTWLLTRLIGPCPAPARGLRFGAVAGLVFGVTAVLGTYSVVPMPGTALIVRPVSFAVASAAAGVAASVVLGGDRPWLRLLYVFLAAVVLFIAGVEVQNLFLRVP